MNHCKSTATYSLKILCCRKKVDLLNEVLLILAGQRAAKLPGVKVWVLKKKSDILGSRLIL